MNDELRIKTFKDLNAWKEGHELVLQVYKISKRFPKEETFGLMSQIRRAVVSITSNIAEGFSRDSYADKKHFYVMAHGSLTEVQNQLTIANDINYLDDPEYEASYSQSVIVHKLLNGLIKATKGKVHNS